MVIVIVIVAVLAIVGAGAALVAPGRRRRKPLPSASAGQVEGIDIPPGEGELPGFEDETAVPRDLLIDRRAPDGTPLPPLADDDFPSVATAPDDLGDLLDTPPPGAGRLTRLRERLSRSQGGLGRGLFALLSRDVLDDDTWEEVEDTLLLADVGVAPTRQIVENLKTKVRVLGTRTPSGLRELLEGELLQVIGTADRGLQTRRKADGKLARVLVGDGESVLLGAADTFRAAAADQLTTWGDRVGATVVRGPEHSDPASVAFDSVQTGITGGVDCVVIDTAGRLHTKTGLMDELGKIKRVVEKLTSVDEVLLVLDATTGQNGVIQAKQFTAMVEVTGIVLTKLDGTAKGGIVISVQRELGIPVKLVGLGEGPDDLAPFEPDVFVDALLGDVGN